MDLFAPDNWEWLTDGNNFRFLLEGFLINVVIAVVGIVFSLIFGLLLALMRISTVRLISVPAGIWVDFWRNIPLILMILYLGLAVPSSWREAWADNIPGWFPEAFQDELVLGGLLALVLYNSAVLCEIMRSGILSLDRGQREAAASLGLTYTQQMRFVILPQGLRRMVPATVSQLITLNKDTTLLTILGINEVVSHANSITGASAFGGGAQAQVLQVYVMVGILFILVNFALSRLSRRLEIRERKRTGTTLQRVEGLEDQVALETDVSAPPR
ncbi:MAG TPA: amino acid ABC transporter permease [Solirubrobacterales bacterium]|nr:amino acid ABC transporter permease [Solirubrobacterales bacterium]